MGEEARDGCARWGPTTRARTRCCCSTSPASSTRRTGCRHGAQGRGSPSLMGLATLRLDSGIFCDSLQCRELQKYRCHSMYICHSIMPLNAMLVLDFSGRALCWPQVPLPLLYAAMCAHDPATGRPRGWVALARAPAGPASRGQRCHLEFRVLGTRHYI